MQTFFKSGALAIAAMTICLILAVFVPALVRPASSNAPPPAEKSAPRTDNDDFTASTTEELISSQTWRSPYAIPGSLAVLIGTYLYAYRRLNQPRNGSR